MCVDEAIRYRLLLQVSQGLNGKLFSQDKLQVCSVELVRHMLANYPVVTFQSPTR